MKLIPPVLRILFGTLFIFSAALKMFPIESFELILIRQVGVSWEWVAYVSRILVLIEFFIGLALISAFEFKKTMLASGLLLLFFSAYLLHQIWSGSQVENCGCFGELIPFSTKQSLIKNAVMLAFGALVWMVNRKKQNPSLSKIFLPLAYVSMIYVLFQAPFPAVKSQSIGNNSVAPFESIAANQSIDLTRKQFFLIMFAECAHCERLASSLSALKLENVERLHVLVFGHPTRVNEFSEKTNIERFNPTQTSDRALLKAIDGTFPTMVYIDSAKIQSLWNGASINIELMKKHFSN